MICFVFAIILCVSAAPIPYKSFQDYQGTGKLIPVSPHATGFNTTAVPKAWFYPKSMAEYRRRKNQTQDHQVYEMQVTTAQPLHSFSSSIASF
ncbi:unnamed protein product [Rotaria magnacalcarata]